MSAEQERIARLQEHEAVLLDACKAVLEAGAAPTDRLEMRWTFLRRVTLPSGCILRANYVPGGMNGEREWGIFWLQLFSPSEKRLLAQARWSHVKTKDGETFTPDTGQEAFQFVSDPGLAEMGAIRALVGLWKDKQQAEARKAAANYEAAVSHVLKHGKEWK